MGALPIAKEPFQQFVFFHLSLNFSCDSSTNIEIEFFTEIEQNEKGKHTLYKHLQIVLNLLKIQALFLGKRGALPIAKEPFQQFFFLLFNLNL